MTPEIELVLGQSYHIRNGDVRPPVIAVIIAGVVSFFAGTLVYRLLFKGGFREQAAQPRRWCKRRLRRGDRVALIAVARHFHSIVIRFALSRQP